MEISVWDYFWVLGILLMNLLIYARKGILWEHGYRFCIIDYFFDDRWRLSEIAAKEQNPRKKRFYRFINICIPLLFFGSGILCLVLHFPFHRFFQTEITKIGI